MFNFCSLSKLLLEMILRLQFSILTKKLIAINLTLRIVLAEDRPNVADGAAYLTRFVPGTSFVDKLWIERDFY